MRIDSVLLGQGVDGRRRVRWRTMTGADELELFGCDFAASVEWLSSMLVGGDGWIEGSDVLNLTLGDGDRLFEAVYRALFGPLVEFRHRCASCGEGYELSLSLDCLVSPAGDADETGQGQVELAGGTTVRGLCINDLLTAERDPAALLERAVIGRGSDDDEAIATAVDRLSSPHMETVETSCPHCKGPQAFAFDLSSFLLRCCARERPILLREIHLLARTYAWSLADITALNRSARHDLVRLIVAASPARLKGRAA